MILSLLIAQNFKSILQALYKILHYASSYPPITYLDSEVIRANLAVLGPETETRKVEPHTHQDISCIHVLKVSLLKSSQLGFLRGHWDTLGLSGSL